MVQDIKHYQEAVSRNLKTEIRDGILETLQVWNLGTHNQEHEDPNTSPFMAPYGTTPRYIPVQPLDQFTQAIVSQNNMFGASMSPDPAVMMLLQQLQKWETNSMINTN